MILWQLDEPLNFDGIEVHYLNIFRIDAETRREGGTREPYFTIWYAACDETGKEIARPDGQGGIEAVGSGRIVFSFNEIPQEIKTAHADLKQAIFNSVTRFAAGQVVDL